MDAKTTRLSGGPDMCPLVFDQAGQMTCTIKRMPCKIYTAYGFCPIYATWKSSKKFTTRG